VELPDANKDRLPYDCMDAGGRVTQEQLPKDPTVEQPKMVYASLNLTLAASRQVDSVDLLTNHRLPYKF